MATPVLRVLVTGSRDWRERAVIHDVLALLPKGTLVIHGACRGADLLADAEARKLGFDVKAFPADWDGPHGLAAGPIRNGQMLSIGKPDLVVYFHRSLATSKGTRDMTERSRAAGVPVYDGAMVADRPAFRDEFRQTVKSLTRTWKG